MRWFLALLLAALTGANVHAQTPSGSSLIISPVKGNLAPQTLARLKAHPSVREVTPVFGESESRAVRTMGEPELAATYRIELKKNQDTADFVRWARARLPGVRIDPNPLVHLNEDLLEKHQWGIRNRGLSQRVALDEYNEVRIPGVVGEDIRIDGAPAENMSAERRIRVAVLDTGIDVKHPDLVGQIHRKESECKLFEEYNACLAPLHDPKKPLKDDEEKKIQTECDQRFLTQDTDGNGYPIDCVGWDVTAGISMENPTRAINPVTGIMGSPLVEDRAGHGTHIAGVIGARLDGQGIRGVARNVALIPVKVISSSPNAPIRPQNEGDLPSPIEKQLASDNRFGDIVARGILYAIRSDAQIIHMSLAWPRAADTLLLSRMVALARKRGILVVASAGNDSTDTVVYPCHYEDIVCVAAHGPNGALTHFSNYGSAVEIAAPGMRILSTWPTKKDEDIYDRSFHEHSFYELKNGTSMAAPFVTGALSRLLNAGMSTREAYARLLVGARASAPSQHRSPKLVAKTTRSGNLDLSASFRSSPEPLILPARKEWISLEWDRKTLELPIRIPMRNLWSQARQVQITVTAPRTRLSQSEFKIADWNPGEDRELKLSLILDRPRVDGKIILQVSVTADGGKTRKYQVPVDVSSTLERDSQGDNIAVLPADLTGLLPAQSGRVIRPIRRWLDRSKQDYLFLTRGTSEWTYEVVESRENAYRFRSRFSFPAPKADLLAPVHRVDVDFDGQDELVFIYKMREGAGTSSVPPFRFEYMSLDLKPKQLFPITADNPGGNLQIYDNESSLISERFQWLRQETPGGPRRIPVWLTVGTIPQADTPPYDPWLTPLDRAFQMSPDSRLYQLKLEGVRLIAPPQGFEYIQALLPTTEDRRRGEMRLLLASVAGRSSRRDYEIATLRSGTLVERTPLQLPKYRTLLPTNFQVEILGLEGDTYLGSGIVGLSDRGVLPTTWFGAGLPVQVLHSPLDEIDSAKSVVGIFRGASRAGAFIQTNYELQYDDLGSRESASVSLNRFSFMPRLVFAKALQPAIAESKHGRLPAVLLPLGLNDAPYMEVTLPLYNESGKLLGLQRPAHLRLKESETCQSIASPQEPSSSEPSAVMFFCGDRFLKVRLSE